jgi:hypothetical protein
VTIITHSNYNHAFKNELKNAHSNLVDAKAQTEIILHLSYHKVYKYKSTFKEMTEPFFSKYKNCIAKEMEPVCPVHAEWKSDSDVVTWNP